MGVGIKVEPLIDRFSEIWGDALWRDKNSVVAFLTITSKYTPEHDYQVELELMTRTFDGDIPGKVPSLRNRLGVAVQRPTYCSSSAMFCTLP